MNILCRSRILVSSVCRKSSLIDQSAVPRCTSLIFKARCHRLAVNLSSCQQRWRYGACLKCPFESKRCYTDRGEGRLTERPEKLEDETEEVEDNRSNSNSQNQGKKYLSAIIIKHFIIASMLFFFYCINVIK